MERSEGAAAGLDGPEISLGTKVAMSMNEYQAKPLSPQSKQSGHTKRSVVGRFWTQMKRKLMDALRTLPLKPHSLMTGSRSRKVFARCSI